MNPISKHLEGGLKKPRLRLVYSTYFSGLWKSDETLLLVFDTSLNEYVNVWNVKFFLFQLIPYLIS